MPAEAKIKAPDTLAERIEDTRKRLAAEFGTRFSILEINKVTAELLAAYQNAPVQDFVPLLVERQTRERLLSGQALAG